MLPRPALRQPLLHHGERAFHPADRLAGLRRRLGEPLQLLGVVPSLADELLAQRAQGFACGCHDVPSAHQISTRMKSNRTWLAAFATDHVAVTFTTSAAVVSIVVAGRTSVMSCTAVPLAAGTSVCVP